MSSMMGWVDAAEVTSAWQRMVRVFPFDPPDPDDQPRSDAELIQVLRDTDALIAQATAAQARAVRELRARRLARQAEVSGHPVGGCGSSSCCDPDGWVAAEVVAEVGLSDTQVHARLELAERLARHPAVEATLDTGQVQAWTATRLLEHLHTLGVYVTPGQLAQSEAATLAWLAARRRTVTQLNARMRRLIQLARAAARRDTDPHDPDPDGDGMVEPGHARRRVVITPGATAGTAELWALLPEADALAIKATLAALGHDRVGPDDPRSADQRRADLLHALVTGRVARHGHPTDTTCALRGPVDLQVHLDVTIPADSLTTTGAAPGRVPGYGDIPATTTRDLTRTTTGAAAGAGGAGATGCSARPLVYDPDTGRLLGFGATPVRMTWLDQLPSARGYQHPAPLETAVKLRDGTCRAPGCTRPAARCDCDHATPWPTGPTSLANSCSLCRRHHRLKTHAPDWTMQITPDGTVTWTTPTGTQVTTEPADYRPPTVPGPAPGAGPPSGSGPTCPPAPPTDPDPPPF
jgi:hypothetical protein